MTPFRAPATLAPRSPPEGGADGYVPPRVRANFPGLVSAVESYVSRLLETVTPLAQPALVTPAQMDELLMSVVDRVTAQCAPREASEGDVLTGAMVNIVARETVSRMRDAIARRVVGAVAG